MGCVSSIQQQRREDENVAILMYLEGMEIEVSSFTERCDNALERLLKMKDEVVKIHRGCNISKTVGATVVALGGIGAIGGALCYEIANELQGAKTR